METNRHVMRRGLNDSGGCGKRAVRGPKGRQGLPINAESVQLGALPTRHQPYDDGDVAGQNGRGELDAAVHGPPLGATLSVSRFSS